MIRILFVCVANSARSQLAEEYCRKYGGDRIEAESAGLEPGVINPFVAKVLLEGGIDIRGKKTRSVVDLHREGKLYEYVITVCSRETEARCPVFPGLAERLLWPFPDPAAFTGTEDEILSQTRTLAHEIEAKVKAFISTL